MFRENYLPKGNIYKCSSSGKYFFKKEGKHKLVVTSSGKFTLDDDFKFITPYYADTLDEILAALYEFAYHRHLSQIHTDITHSRSIMI